MNTLIHGRRDFLRAAALAAVSLLLPELFFGTRPSDRKPNIVFILADDQGWHQLGCYRNDFYETPNIDRLAKEGMRFTDAYAASPVCSPTRASIMTGKYPARLRLTNYIPGWVSNRKLLPPDYTRQLRLEEVTVAEALRPVGYTSGHFGKWHLNKDKNYRPGRPGDPGSQGFDQVLTTRKPRSDADPLSDPHHVREITERSIAFIREHRDGPFFCYVSHNSIHRPVMEHPDLVAKYRAKPGSKQPRNHPVVGAMVETLDRSVGRIVDTLDELKIAQQTIVIYFSDNGPLRGQEQLKPLRSGKGHLYDGGIRVPLIVRWPGVVRPSTYCHVPVSSVDFFSTLAEAAGQKVTAPTVDGESLIPLLKQTGSLKRDAIYWHYPHYSPQSGLPAGAIREGNYKLIEWYEKSIDGIDVHGAVELFDLEADISEQNDLARKMPELAARLHGKLRQWRGSVKAQEMIKNPDFGRKKRP